MDSTELTPIEKAARICGGFAELGRRVGVSAQAAHKWAKRVPAERCKDIEKATGGQVTKSELRPDIYAQED